MNNRQQGGSGNFENDRERASEAGRKGGEQSAQNRQQGGQPGGDNRQQTQQDAGNRGQHGGSGNFAQDRERASEAGRKGGQSVPDEKRSFSQDQDLASEAGRKGGQR
ncbi:general stress protein [Xanthobacter wiegelii]|uniref:general stress protein n=1 Tax=Xanthobacter wiegelii TaxID=3119913 RepID=UPI004040930F